MNYHKLRSEIRGSRLRIPLTGLGEANSFIGFDYDKNQFHGYFKPLLELVDGWMNIPQINRTIIITTVTN